MPLNSFLSFALAMAPPQKVVWKSTTASGEDALALKLEAAPRLGPLEISTLDALIDKYRPLKGILREVLDTGEGEVPDQATASLFKNLDYKLVRVSSEQFELAKDVAARIEKIDVLRTAGKEAEAKNEYDSYQLFMKGKRDTLLGDFKDINLTSVALHGADAAGAETQAIPIIVICIGVVLLVDCRTVQT